MVGFYHPCCAIQGLRYCAHLYPDSPALDAGRWLCAVVRRLGFELADALLSRCGRMGAEVQAKLVADVQTAIWAAPVWRQGGFLYAHVPLPHPPGLGTGGSLQEDYDGNVERAARMVESMVERARQEKGASLNFVIFSDHPLRPALWCSLATYRGNGCPLQVRLVDTQVPLIVAGDVPFNIDSISSNRDVFSIATAIEP